MIRRLAGIIRNRWHPLWRLRQLSVFRWFQRKFDLTVFTRMPGLDLPVAVKALRDASRITNPGQLEPEIRTAFALVLDSVRPAVFWDIGANIGFYSWLVRQHEAVKSVVMFEPDPTNFALIQSTLRKNRITNCQVLQVAVSDRCGEATFLLDPVSGATGTLQGANPSAQKNPLHEAYRMGETITCLTTTIDSLIADGLAAPDLIKIDVEEAEHLVLAGGAACLSTKRPVLIVETFSSDLVRRVSQGGYRAFHLDAGNFLFLPAACDFALKPFEDTFPEIGGKSGL